MNRRTPHAAHDEGATDVDVVTTFPRRNQWERAQPALDASSIPYRIISPDPAYQRVAVPAPVMNAEARMRFQDETGDAIVVSGWVDYRQAQIKVPEEEPPTFDEDIFGEVSIMVLAPCVADATRIRIIAHVSGNLTEALPYLNAEMPQACYSPNGPTFTFTEGVRRISLYPRSIAVGKAEEIVDAWRVLEMIRRIVNGVWARRREIEPSHEMRHRPPVLEIFKHLPRTNCRACGELTCLAFAAKLYAGQTEVLCCRPVFEGEYAHLRDPLLEMGTKLGNAFSADKWVKP